MNNNEIKRRINGASVRALREALGIKAIDLAARAHITKSTLSHVENGSRQVSATTLREIATGLAVPTEAISYPESLPARTSRSAA